MAKMSKSIKELRRYKRLADKILKDATTIIRRDKHTSSDYNYYIMSQRSVTVIETCIDIVKKAEEKNA
jgi:hypothetical protein